MAAKSYKNVAIQYAEAVLKGKRKAGKEVVLACARFMKDLQRDDLELRTKPGTADERSGSGDWDYRADDGSPTG